MKQGRVVFEGTTKKENKIVIRYVTRYDAPEMRRLINEISKEKSFIRFQGEEISVEEEEKYLKEELNKVEKGTAVKLHAFFEDKLIGVADIHLRDKVENHEGTFGIIVAKEFRGEGIGRLLMEFALKEAEKELLGLRIITLGVFGGNDLAEKMYKSFGFKEYGRLPEGILRRGKYIDHVFMYKKIR
ncbi:MAG: GNAT family N-acetyltransferase [Patescibacteria group bacterium]|nr:GNAT family N-acetyltransferase [Patescibacteria group bacterium]